MILTEIIHAKIYEGAIASVCRILHNRNDVVNETNVIKELKLIMRERGTLGIEYIYDLDSENPPYENLDEDVSRICKKLEIKTNDKEID